MTDQHQIETHGADTTAELVRVPALAPTWLLYLRLARAGVVMQRAADDPTGATLYSTVLVEPYVAEVWDALIQLGLEVPCPKSEPLRRLLDRVREDRTFRDALVTVSQLDSPEGLRAFIAAAVQ